MAYDQLSDGSRAVVDNQVDYIHNQINTNNKWVCEDPVYKLKEIVEVDNL